MSNIHVFIYGSLLPGQSNYGVVERFVKRSEPGVIMGRLVDVGTYPAAVRDEAARKGYSVIRGLWIEVDRSGLAAMDGLEEFAGIEELNDYERVWVSDLADQSKQGWVYIWESDRGCPAVAEDYWPDYVLLKQKN